MSTIPKPLSTSSSSSTTIRSDNNNNNGINLNELIVDDNEDIDKVLQLKHSMVTNRLLPLLVVGIRDQLPSTATEIKVEEEEEKKDEPSSSSSSSITVPMNIERSAFSTLDKYDESFSKLHQSNLVRGYTTLPRNYNYNENTTNTLSSSTCSTLVHQPLIKSLKDTRLKELEIYIEQTIINGPLFQSDLDDLVSSSYQPSTPKRTSSTLDLEYQYSQTDYFSMLATQQSGGGSQIFGNNNNRPNMF
ncbi:hypothetical protein DFA_12201 [Cavenderia fasciculata]|uniref:Uncharacterized protein n=1 Tax=Cavenderia fasciculata TaxID=261658 RepID=F4QCK1_CACFS|nr:uncharacterized protein DFA_12201 [Cavenderia fasciculata]EGG14429.1 hypothetical protein DFA_12201 [Cavenderia fasciculata]|eukprot:XP_004353838.1 hypothetical protein DFA_12201 [Cavenderia fasciculata]